MNLMNLSSNLFWLHNFGLFCNYLLNNSLRFSINSRCNFIINDILLLNMFNFSNYINDFLTLLLLIWVLLYLNFQYLSRRLSLKGSLFSMLLFDFQLLYLHFQYLSSRLSLKGSLFSMLLFDFHLFCFNFPKSGTWSFFLFSFNLSWSWARSFLFNDLNLLLNFWLYFWLILRSTEKLSHHQFLHIKLLFFFLFNFLNWNRSRFRLNKRNLRRSWCGFKSRRDVQWLGFHLRLWLKCFSCFRSDLFKKIFNFTSIITFWFIRNFSNYCFVCLFYAYRLNFMIWVSSLGCLNKF